MEISVSGKLVRSSEEWYEAADLRDCCSISCCASRSILASSFLLRFFGLFYFFSPDRDTTYSFGEFFGTGPIWCASAFYLLPGCLLLGGWSFSFNDFWLGDGLSLLWLFWKANKI